MMTRKHFEALAETINKQVVYARNHHDDKVSQDVMMTAFAIANDVSKMCKKENKNFDETRFLTACGL